MRVWLRLVLVVLLVGFSFRAWWLDRQVEQAPPAAAATGTTAETDTDAARAAAAAALRDAEQRASASLAWTVTRLNWADGVLVVDVETARPAEDARAIAEQVVAPLDDGYEEVLVYVRAPASADDPILHRIRWTPAEGYVEASFAER